MSCRWAERRRRAPSPENGLQMKVSFSSPSTLSHRLPGRRGRPHAELPHPPRSWTWSRSVLEQVYPGAGLFWSRSILEQVYPGAGLFWMEQVYPGAGLDGAGLFWSRFVGTSLPRGFTP